MGFVAALVPAAALAQQQQQPNADDYIRQPLRLDQRFDRTFEGNCRYSVEVKGTITPLPGQENAKVPQVSPNVTVSAIASCPNEEAVNVSQNIIGDGPLTWRQLEGSLADRAQVVTVESQHQCTYAPKFHVAAARVEISAFDYHCTAI
jgi:hypothetical protein